MAAASAVAQPVPRLDARLVREDTGQPLADAVVSIVGATGTVRTNAEGRFTWVPAPPLPAQLIVVLAGGQVLRPVVVESIDEGVTTIQIGTLADEAITVLGAAPSVNRAPAAAAAVLSGAQITQRDADTLIEALETVPGISQVSEGHAAVPAVRGLARGRTLFLIDGGRITAERRVGPSGTFLDPSVIEAIDIARGPGSVAYGSDAMGGVVSVRTRRAEPNTPLRARVTGTIGGGVPEARAAFELSKGLARGGVLVQAHVRNTEDYESPEGEVFNSGWEDQGFLVHLTHVVGKGHLSTAWQSDLGRDVERPRNNSRTVRFYYPFENSHRFTTAYEVPDVLGFRQVTLTGFFGGYHQRTDQDRVPTQTTGRSIERADVSANDFHVKADAERLAKSVRLNMGVDVNGRFDLEALDIIQAFDLSGAITRDTTNVSVDNAKRVDAGIYLQTESALGHMARVSAGLRADRVTTKNTGGYFGDRSTAHAAVSGLAALTLTPVQRVSVTAQVARGFRDPVLSDRYFRGPSGRGFITGNPDLEPETSLQFDVATQFTTSRTQLAVYFYNYRIERLVERYQTQTDFFFFRNRGRARLRGAEIEARTELGRGYSVDAAAQIASGRALDDRANLDDISPPTLSLLGRKEFSREFYAQARLAWYAEDTRPGPSEVTAPGATLLDVGAGGPLHERVGLRGTIRNLLNEAYYASPDARWVLAAGRSVSLTVVVQF